MNRLSKLFVCAVLIAVFVLAFAFAEGEGVSSVVLPGKLNAIEEEAFAGDKSIKKVVVPEGTTRIESRAFANTKIRELVLPSSLTYIAEDAFDGCPSFKIIVSKDCYAYERCRELKLIDYTISGKTEDGFYFRILNGEATITGWDWDICGPELVLPDLINDVPVYYIAGYAFQEALESIVTGYHYLKSVIIPEGVVTIGPFAFWGCVNLTDVTIPKSVQYINEHAFDHCSNLEKVYGMEGVIVLGEGAFASCEKLDHVSLPDTLKNLGSDTFVNCVSITSIEIPDSVIYDGGAFEGCTGLKSVTLSSSLKSPYNGVYPRCFQGCASLKRVIIPDGYTFISSYAFEGCARLTSVYIPESVTRINIDSETGDTPFEGCYNLTIYGKAGSYAEEFAERYGFDFSTGDLPATDEEIILLSDCYRFVSKYEYDGKIYSEAVLTKAYNGVSANSFFFMNDKGRPVTDLETLSKLYTMRMLREMEAEIDSSIDIMHNSAKIWSSSAKKFMANEAIWSSAGTAIAETIKAYATGGTSFLAMLKNIAAENVMDGNELSAWMQIAMIDHLLEYMGKLNNFNSSFSAKNPFGVYEYELVKIKLALFVDYRYTYEVSKGLCVPVVEKIVNNFKNNGQVLMHLVGKMFVETATGVFPTFDASVAIVKACMDEDANAWELVDALLSSMVDLDDVSEDFKKFAEQMALVTELLMSYSKLENAFILEENEWLDVYFITLEELAQSQLYKNHLLIAQ